MRQKEDKMVQIKKDLEGICVDFNHLQKQIGHESNEIQNRANNLMEQIKLMNELYLECKKLMNLNKN